MEGKWDNAFERKVVYFASDTSLYNLQHGNNGRQLLRNPELIVVGLSDSGKFLNAFNIADNVVPTDASMFVLSPFSDKIYIAAESARIQVAYSKITKIMHIAQLLGASLVEIENSRILDKTSGSDLKISGSSPVLSGDLQIKSNDLKSLWSKFRLKTNFAGGTANYKQAEKVARESNLAGDSFISTLLEMRHNISASNPLKSVTQEVSLTESVQTNLDIAAQASYLVGNANVTYQRALTEKVEFYSTIRIEF
ncbi:MAG: hypothetical protein J0L99_06575 [Chitinophagales bacterium]|nr:hypothetical protein [Chitinophagales bacterium]